MEDIYFDYGSSEANERMVEHINNMCTQGTPGGTSIWDGRCYVEPDTLSRESSDVQSTVYDIIAHSRS